MIQNDLGRGGNCEGARERKYGQEWKFWSGENQEFA